MQGETSARNKALVPLDGVPILVRIVEILARAGVTEAVVVIGYERNQIRTALADRGNLGIELTLEENRDWRKSNGLSVVAAGGALECNFLLDIAVADVAISNFSSILNYFYGTGRPSIQIYPVTAGEAGFTWRRYRGSRPVRGAAGPGGAGLEQPDSCRERSARFLKTYLTGVDGQACERLAAALRSFAVA